MTIDWEDRRKDPQAGDALYSLAERVVLAALAEDRLTDKVNLGITLVDDEEIAQINRTFRAVDSATDVLSFPMHDGDLAAASQSGLPGDIDPATGELMLGDIVVSVDRARAQAQEYGHSFEREFGFLITHGMLHLLGFDHQTPADEETMTRIQEQILQSLELTREQEAYG